MKVRIEGTLFCVEARSDNHSDDASEVGILMGEVLHMASNSLCGNLGEAVSIATQTVCEMSDSDTPKAFWDALGKLHTAAEEYRTFIREYRKALTAVEPPK